MSNLDVTDSEREETPNSSSTDAKKKPKGSMNRRNAKDVPEYEKQRLSRIAENKKRMEALGLAKLATSFLDSSMDLRKIDRKGKRKLGEAADEDYKPGNDSSSSEDDDSEEEDEDFGSGKVSGSRGMKNGFVNQHWSTSSSSWVILLRRNLTDDKAIKWCALLNLLETIGPSNLRTLKTWTLSKEGCFSVSSLTPGLFP